MGIGPSAVGIGIGPSAVGKLFKVQGDSKNLWITNNHTSDINVHMQQAQGATRGCTLQSEIICVGQRFTKAVSPDDLKKTIDPDFQKDGTWCYWFFATPTVPPKGGGKWQAEVITLLYCEGWTYWGYPAPRYQVIQNFQEATSSGGYAAEPVDTQLVPAPTPDLPTVTQSVSDRSASSPTVGGSSPVGTSPPYWTDKTSDQGWLLHPVDAKTKAALDQMLAVTQPRELGQGRDASKYHRAYTNLPVYCAWRLENPNLWLAYCGRRAFVAKKLQYVSGSLRVPSPFQVGAETKLTAASQALPGELEGAAGEGYFLHGTAPKFLAELLDCGPNGRVASLSSAFGVGVYLAEEIEKIDQYALPDPTYEAEDLEDLHARLFRAGGHHHPGEDLFYCVVIRATLGASLVTRGMCREEGKTHFDTDDKTKQIFINKDRRELVAVPGTHPPLHYHSLIVDTGAALRRFREFVVLDPALCYAEYLVAYRRT